LPNGQHLCNRSTFAIVAPLQSFSESGKIIF
jgi:hypothetical protein